MSDESTWTAANNRQWRWRFWRALFPFSSPLSCLPPLLGLRNIGGPSWGCWTFPPKAFFYPHERKISQFCFSETRYKVEKGRNAFLLWISILFVYFICYSSVEEEPWMFCSLIFNGWESNQRRSPLADPETDGSARQTWASLPQLSPGGGGSTEARFKGGLKPRSPPSSISALVGASACMLMAVRWKEPLKLCIRKTVRWSRWLLFCWAGTDYRSLLGSEDAKSLVYAPKVQREMMKWVEKWSDRV